MALVSVLLVSVVLLALSGAFFMAHKADLALLGAASYREQTKNACLSLADFVQYKLQNDRKFGKALFDKDGTLPAPEVFPPSDVASPFLDVRYVGERVMGRWRNMIRGSMPESGVEFDVEVLNNLDGASWGRSVSGTTPPRTARAWITARRGSVIQRIDFIMKQRIA